MELTFGLQEIETTAREFLGAVKDYKIFALHGNLGAGKTTFIRAVCNVLRVKDHVTSPTFNIIHTYNSDNGKIIYHLDLYRVKDSAEAVNAGVEECLYSGELCFVEWPEKVFEILPLETVQVFLAVIDESHRKLEIKFP
jgi:tRNA threonylcarbamoyladenosine biosynthesis protein TsaE